MTTLTCIDLRERFGDRYRLTTDESAGPRNMDPWLWQIPCRYGAIWPWGGDRLAVSVDYHRGIAKQVRALPGVRREQGGDDEHTYSFPISLFEQVAEIVQPRRKRKLPEASRAAFDAGREAGLRALLAAGPDQKTDALTGG